MQSRKINLNSLHLKKNNLFLMIAILVTCFILVATVAQAEEIPADFDHDDTNFLLSGAHRKVECKICHVRDVYQGIPLTCEECHSASSLIAKTKKTNNHFESVDTCDNCHTVETWLGARIDHDSVVGTCIDCHNNISTPGKPADHIKSVDECHKCHTTRRWKQSGFDHTVITGNCFSCHNGSTAKGKHEKHRLSNNQCDDCHNVENWKHKIYDHKDIKAACITCHQDVLPKLPHPQNNKCERCHSPKKKWRQVRFMHEKTVEFCVNCHRNAKPPGHFIISTSETNIRCDDCHRAISSWLSKLRFDHEVIGFQEHRTNTPCLSCHLANSDRVIYTYGAHRPHCAACHQSNYRKLSHLKYPNVYYEVAELHDCTSSCHSYTDSSLTTRDNSRNKNANYHNALRGRGITVP
ncbi:MAG: hypothetical protein ACC657_03335 [Thiohalomonadales bacterium]